MDPGPAQRVDGELQRRAGQRREVDDVGEVVDVGGDVVVPVRRAGAQGEVVVEALHFGQAVGDELVGAVLDPPGRGCVGGASVGRVVLEAAVFGWIVRRRYDDAVTLRLAFVGGVVGQN